MVTKRAAQQKKSIQFHVVPRHTTTPSGAWVGYLIEDNWDDWGEFRTTFRLVVYDGAENKHAIGELKIGQFSMKKGQRSPEISTSFKYIGDLFFSLGQDNSYYKNLLALDPPLRDALLQQLNDVVVNEHLFERVLGERVTKVSLLRSVSIASVRGQFKRVLNGDAISTPFSFEYTLPKLRGSKSEPTSLQFLVKPDSLPPSNVHVLIGRNGVGKTRILNHMALAIQNTDKATTYTHGVFDFDDDVYDEQFSNVVSVTFSAFDPFDPLPESRDKSRGINYSYVGLKRQNNIGGKFGSPKSPEIISREFVKSLKSSLQGANKIRWCAAMAVFENDPNFRDSEVSLLGEDIESKDEKIFESEASSRFERLSTGHKIVVFTLTKMIELVEEKTLVLFDEPESHLHPPLLSAFIRALSNLLTNRNGVAILATHSPVVLQEVPRSCVWILARSGNAMSADRPEEETFGENVGVLTREAFGLEVMDSGFNKLISDAVRKNDTFDDVLHDFNGKLGIEGRAIARTMMANKSRQRQ